MKTTTLNVSFLILLIFEINNCFGQVVNANTAEVNLSAPSTMWSCENTGNDIADYGGHLIEVTVADDITNPWINMPLVWFVNGTYAGADGPHYYGMNAMPDGYLDPDVCLVHNGSTLFAFVVYLSYEPNINNPSVYDCYYILECWEYEPSSRLFYSIGCSVLDTYVIGGAIPNTADFEINIDGGFNDYKCVVTWNDILGKKVWAWAGHIGEQGCAQLCSNGPFEIYDATARSNWPQAALPDVAINRNNIYFTYLVLPASGVYEIEIASIPFNGTNGLCTSSPMATPIYNTSPSTLGEFNNPRIACPNVSSSTTGVNDRDYMVVATETNNSTIWGVFGINYFHSVGWTTYSYYNDGISPSPFDLTSVPNVKPVVAYDEDGNIIIGWIWDNTSPLISAWPAIKANYPIAINCDHLGVQVGPWFDYMNIPYWVNPNDNYTTLSIAGRNTNISKLNLFSFYKTGADLYSKTKPEGSWPLRIGRGNKNGENIMIILSESYGGDLIQGDEIVTLKIFDLTNKEIISLNGKFHEVASAYRRSMKYWAPGVYVGNIYTSERNIISGKIMLMQ